MTGASAAMGCAAGLLPEYRPYEVVDSGCTAQEILAEIGERLYTGHSPVAPRTRQQPKVTAEPLDRYAAFLSRLQRELALEFVPFRRLCAEPCPPNRVRCGIRHDVDIDIEAAIGCARIERELGISSTYFVLHTAAYYGRFIDGRLLRHASMAACYRRLQALGHEVALHTDPLHLYQNLGVDGGAALRTELAWLRDEGLDVVGTVAQNSAAAYGIDNSAVFKGRVRTHTGLPGIRPLQPTATEVWFDGKAAPLQVLDESELGLIYEAADDLLYQSHTPVAIAALLRTNTWYWSGRRGVRSADDGAPEGELDEDQLVAELARTPPGTWLVLLIHPMYYGARRAPGSAPGPLRTCITTRLDETLGWETYVPDSVQARHAECDGAVRFSALIRSNSFGMLDLPPVPVQAPAAPQLEAAPGVPASMPASASEAAASDVTRVWLFGGDNVDGNGVGLDAHLSLVAERALAAAGRPHEILKFAFPGMGVSRLYGWFHRLLARLPVPTVVILPFGGDEPARSLVAEWARFTGFSQRHPPGEYLQWDGERCVTVASSPAAAIRRRAPGERRGARSLCAEAYPDNRAHDTESVLACLEAFVEAVRTAGATPLVMLQECGESLGLWDDSVSPATRRAARDRLLATLAPRCAALGVPVLDPYEALEAAFPELPTHWMEAGRHHEWNGTAHRLAGEVLARWLAGRAAAGPESITC